MFFHSFSPISLFFLSKILKKKDNQKKQLSFSLIFKKISSFKNEIKSCLLYISYVKKGRGKPLLRFVIFLINRLTGIVIHYMNRFSYTVNCQPSHCCITVSISCICTECYFHIVKIYRCIILNHR